MDDSLVLRVWYEPEFRARVTSTDQDGAGNSVVLASPDEVLAHVRQWMAGTEPSAPDAN